tara:strand:+ start:215 stop:736 length:522 start_codon:yes stop_codon:yes gene_type:complete
MKNIGYVLLLFIFLSACLPDEPGFDGFRRAEVQRLLSNQDSKRWSLDERFLFNEKISFDSCENPRQLIFSFTAANNDKDSLWYVNPADTCGNSTDTLKGFWFVPPTQTRETSIDTVVFVWERTDTAYFQLEIINPENLTISTYFVEDSLKEIFTHFPLPPEEEEEEEEDGEGN